MPRLTIGRMMLVVALMAVCTPALYLFWGLDPPGWLTVYAPGYTEAKFDTLKPGMTSGQVEAVMGKPLHRVPWGSDSFDGGDEMWFYSDNHVDTANFHRRWVLFRGGKSAVIIKDFWVD